MIVEFTGCTASGKTSLMGRVTKPLSRHGFDTMTSIEFLTKTFRLKQCNNPTLQNIILDIFLLPEFFRSFRKNRKLYSFLLKILFQKPDSFLGAVNRSRSVVRKVVVNEILRKHSKSNQVVFIDEGIVHSAHNIFVYSDLPILPDDIKTFSDMVPLPDLLVCVRAPEEIILNRVLSRPDLRQVFDPKDKAQKYIQRGLALFEQLCSIDAIQHILLPINCDDGEDNITERTNDVVCFLLENFRVTNN